MKKSFLSGAVALLLALASVGAAFAGPAVSASVHAVPFAGTLRAVEATEVQGTTLLVHANGSGVATQLGHYTVHYEVVVNLITLSATNTAVFTAANGDKLYASGSGQGTPTNTPNVDSIVENYTITGGTGHFAQATGSFTLRRLLNLVTGQTAGAFAGQLKLHHGH